MSSDALKLCIARCITEVLVQTIVATKFRYYNKSLPSDTKSWCVFLNKASRIKSGKGLKLRRNSVILERCLTVISGLRARLIF